VQLQQRTWLIHWSLFVFFNHPNGRNSIVEMFMQDKSVALLSLVCVIAMAYTALSFQVLDHHSDGLPTHPAVFDNSGHHIQETEKPAHRAC